MHFLKYLMYESLKNAVFIDVTNKLPKKRLLDYYQKNQLKNSVSIKKYHFIYLFMNLF